VAIDLGTGTGQAVLRRARRNPRELVIGVDADAAAMADASRKAASSARHGGLSNALFLAAGAEELPGPLANRADMLSAALPWGSLLHGLLAADPMLVEGICACLKVDGELVLLLSATERDAAATLRLTDLEDATRLASALESAGLQVIECRPADESDVNLLSSGWGKRLRIPAKRSAWVFRARQAGSRSL
jgi:SAM-dependent methyltransferase